jgi:hypothetical protein
MHPMTRTAHAPEPEFQVDHPAANHGRHHASPDDPPGDAPPEPPIAGHGPMPAASVLGLGARERLGAVALLLAMLWAAVGWALGAGS